MTPSEKREIINELRREFVEVLKAINGFQQTTKRLLKYEGEPSSWDKAVTEADNVLWENLKPKADTVPGTMPDMTHKE